MRFATPLLGLAFASLALLGCQHKKRDSGPPRFEQSCTTACERVVACDSSIDAEACEEDCIDSFDPYGSHLRKEYLEEFDACITDARCDDLGASAITNSCRNDARDRIGANLKVVKLCDVVSDTLARCTGGKEMDPAPCVETIKVFNDATVVDAMSCGDVPCSEIGKCFTEALGFVPITQVSTGALRLEP